MKCYKCKTQNSAESTKCSNCGALLKFVCPKCKKVHPLKTIQCDCSYVFLKKCAECGALNKSKNEACRKCGASLDADKIEPSAKTKELVEVEKEASNVILKIEIIGFNLIEAKLKKEESAKKVLNFFYQIVAKNANKLKLKVKKKSKYLLELSLPIENIEVVSSSIKKDAVFFNAGLLKKIGTQVQFSIKSYIDEEVNIIEEVLVEDKIVEQPSMQEAVKEEPVVIEPETKQEVVEKEQVQEPLINKIQSQKPQPVVEESKSAEQEVPIQEAKPTVSVATKEKSLEEEPQEQVQEEQKESGPLYELINRENLFNLFNENLRDSSENFSMVLACENSENPLILINNYVNTLQNSKFIYLLGNCSSYTKNTPFGVFNDIFKSLMGLSYFNMDELQTKEAIEKFLKENFALNDSVVNIFTRFILPSKDSNLVNINFNKEDIYDAFEILFSLLLENAKIILSINNADEMDKDSYELLAHLFAISEFEHDFNIILLKDEQSEIEPEVDFAKISFEPCTFYSLASMGEVETKEYLMMLSAGQVVLPIPVEKEIVYKSKGRSSYLEESFGYLIQKGALALEGDKFKYNTIRIELPDDYEKLIFLRIEDLLKQSQDMYNLLVLASYMGPKFNPIILNSILKFEEDKINQLIGSLISIGILIPFDAYNLVFKNKVIYKTIQNSLKAGSKGHFIKMVIDALANNSVTDSSIYFMLCSQASLVETMIENYAVIEQEMVSRGSLHLLLRIYKELNEAVSTLDFENKKQLKYELNEKAGVLSYEINPDLTVEYLPKIVNAYEEKEQYIEALNTAGYLTKSAMLKSDFNLAIECVNKAIHYIEENEDKIIEKAFLKYIKLKPLFELGYYQEVINLAKNDVLPVLKTVLSRREETITTLEELKDIILEAELYIAKSLTLQVNSDALQALGDVDAKAKKDGNAKILCEQNLYLALYYVLTGYCQKAKKILIDLQGAVSSGQLEMKNVVLWRFITLLNNLHTGDKETVKEEIENITIVSNDLSMHFIEHSLKLIEAKIEGSESLFYDELNYFAQNKIATGALFCWYFIAQRELEKDAQKAFSIAEQALDVCVKPEINNIYFAVLFNKIIAESYIIQGDFENAQIYIEKSYKMAKDQQIHGLEASLFITSAKLFEEKVQNNIDAQESAEMANKLYINAVELANEIKNDYILESAQKDLKEFMTFCQLSNIEF